MQRLGSETSCVRFLCLVRIACPVRQCQTGARSFARSVLPVAAADPYRDPLESVAGCRRPPLSPRPCCSSSEARDPAPRCRFALLSQLDPARLRCCDSLCPLPPPGRHPDALRTRLPAFFPQSIPPPRPLPQLRSL